MAGKGVVAALLAFWQWLLASRSAPARGQRLSMTGAGMMITLVYTARP